MSKETKEKSVEMETVESCPILYNMRFRPMTETCMCWGWECGEGWHENIKDASYELETLNDEFYPKYRVRIQADQVKEKFGTLRFYFSVCRDHGRILTSIIGNIRRLADFCTYNKDFECREVVDVEPYDYDDVRTISKEEYDSRMKSKVKCSNVEFSKNEDGTYTETVHLRNYGRTHYEPTKNRIWWKLGRMLRGIADNVNYGIQKKDSPEIRRIVGYMNTKAGEIVRKYEEKCMKTCEICGCQIGTDWSPSCETVGWVSFICDRCAEKGESMYYMNGKKYHKGKEVKDGKRGSKKVKGNKA